MPKETVQQKWVFCKVYMGVSLNGGIPKWMVKIMENPIKVGDLGILRTPHISIIIKKGSRRLMQTHWISHQFSSRVEFSDCSHLFWVGPKKTGIANMPNNAIKLCPEPHRWLPNPGLELLIPSLKTNSKKTHLKKRDGRNRICFLLGYPPVN